MFENRGVKSSTRVEVAPPGISNNTVMNVAPLKHWALRYVDGEGKLKTTTIVQIGDRFYEPKNAEAWTGQLGPLNDWLHKIVAARVLGEMTAPETDKVDIVGVPA
jgi:hypothetical protein